MIIGNKIHIGSRRKVILGSKLNQPFQITIDTTKAGSASDTFILPTTGSGYDALVKWGDGTEQQITGIPGNVTHVYPFPGIYQISITGLFPRIYFNNVGDKLKLISIDSWGSIAWGSMASAFRGCSNVIGKYKDIANTNATTDMNAMFFGCTQFNSDLLFDTSNVTNMASILQGCSNFNGLVPFDTKNVVTMVNMFYSCSKFNRPVNFNTAKVKLMNGMYAGCDLFNQSLSTFDTSGVTNFSNMLLNCLSFHQDLSTFSLASATNVTDMLKGCNINEVEAGKTISTLNYDNTIISFAGQNVANSLNINMGNSMYNEGEVDRGTVNGTSANKLIDSSKNFTTIISVGDVVRNSTDNTFAFIINIDNANTLSLSADIMQSGEEYTIQHSDAAKARANLLLNKNWTITDGGPFLAFDNGKVVFTFDDGRASILTAYDILNQQGETATLYITSDFVETSGYLTWAQLQTMVSNGIDIQCHAKTHTHMTTLTESQVLAEYEAVNNAFTANGLTPPRHTAYPYGLSNVSVQNWTATMRDTARGTAGGIMQRNITKMNLLTYNMDSGAADYENLKSKILLAKQNRGAITFLGHDVGLNNTQSISESDFNMLIDFAQSEGLDIITIDELYSLLD